MDYFPFHIWDNYIILPIDEHTYFSRWWNCTTNQTISLPFQHKPEATGFRNWLSWVFPGFMNIPTVKTMEKGQCSVKLWQKPWISGHGFFGILRSIFQKRGLNIVFFRLKKSGGGPKTHSNIFKHLQMAIFNQHDHSIFSSNGHENHGELEIKNWSFVCFFPHVVFERHGPPCRCKKSSWTTSRTTARRHQNHGMAVGESFFMAVGGVSQL